jgi:hypothetical protein
VQVLTVPIDATTSPGGESISAWASTASLVT